MVDINQSSWSQTDASNNSSPPTGWPAGMASNQVEPSSRAIMGAVKRWYARTAATVTSAGTANAQTLTYAVAPAALVSGDVFRFKVGLQNTGAVTLNINGLGAVPLYQGTKALAGGELEVNQIIDATYDGSHFQVMRSKTPTGFVNILDYGGDNTNTNDNTPALARAIAINSAVYFPAGTYKFSTSFSHTLGASENVYIEGDLGTIISSTLAGGAVWAFVKSDTFATVDIRGFVFKTLGGIVAGTAISFLGSDNGITYGYSSLKDVSFIGTNTNYFDWGVSATSWSSINFYNCNFTGTSQLGGGCRLASISTNVGVVYNFHGCSFSLLNRCLEWGDWVQGLSVSQCNFSYSNEGITAPTGAGTTQRDQLLVIGTQFGVNGKGIFIQGSDCSDVVVSNNYFIIGNGNSAVYLNVAPGRAIIADNWFRYIDGAATSGDALAIFGTVANGQASIHYSNNVWDCSNAGKLIGLNAGVVTPLFSPKIVAVDNVATGIGTGTTMPFQDVTGNFVFEWIQSGFHIKLGTSAGAGVVPPGQGGFGGHTISWNESGAGAEVNIWNLFSNPAPAFKFHYLTGVGTFATPMEITRTGLNTKDVTLSAQSAPSSPSGTGWITYTDSLDGALKAKNAAGVVRTLALP